MHGAFHIDAFIVAFMLAALLTVLIRWVYNKIVKFLRHLIWMRRKAGGTLVTDSEAAYWLKLIERPDYKPIWRWYYAEEWKRRHAHSDKKEGKKRISRKAIVAVIVVAALLIVLFFVVPNFNSPLTFQIVSHISVIQAYNATLINSGEYGYDFRAYDNVRSVVFLIEFSRTDSLFGSRQISFDVIVQNFTLGDLPKRFYVNSATYVFASGDTVDVFDDESTDQKNLGFVANMNSKDRGQFIVFLNLDSYYVANDLAKMLTIQSTGGDTTVTVWSPRIPVI